LPGAFIIAINHFMRTKCISSEFDWIASSYLPEAGALAGNTTILEDKYKIYEKNRLHWLMGPPPNALPEGETPVSGDVTDPAVIKSLGYATHRRFAINDGANLYTSDVGIDIPKEDLNRQEELTSFVNFGQIIAGLLSLAVGGNMVTKQYTFITPFSRSLIAIVASLFDETYITKPKTSRPTNSEVYLVGKGFRGISPELSEALLARVEAYKTIDKLPTTWGSLIRPDILAKVDADILAAGQAVHGEQQVAFLNEISEAYRVLSGNANMNQLTKIYEKSAQEEWLKENPIAVISMNENLTNAIPVQMAEMQAQQPPPMQQALPQMRVPVQPELEEESILIPEETDEEGEGEGKEGEGEGKEGEGEIKEGSKKTIKFNL
jgi:hypothetical protein